MQATLKRSDGEEQKAEWVFASWADIGHLQGWTEYLQKDSSANMKDSADFARQAVSRWLKYADEGMVANSWEDARARSEGSPEQEFVLLVVLKADWWVNPLEPLAFAYLRRTWCGGLYLEFMASHPVADGRVRGVLRATLKCIASAVQVTDGQWAWWEATKTSFDLYERCIGTANILHASEPRIRDVFVVTKARLQTLPDKG